MTSSRSCSTLKRVASSSTWSRARLASLAEINSLAASDSAASALRLASRYAARAAATWASWLSRWEARLARRFTWSARETVSWRSDSSASSCTSGLLSSSSTVSGLDLLPRFGQPPLHPAGGDRGDVADALRHQRARAAHLDDQRTALHRVDPDRRAVHPGRRRLEPVQSQRRQHDRGDGEPAVEQLLPAAPGRCPRNVHASSSLETRTLSRPAGRPRHSIGKDRATHGRDLADRHINDLRTRPIGGTIAKCADAGSANPNSEHRCAAGPRRARLLAIPPVLEHPMATGSPKDPQAGFTPVFEFESRIPRPAAAYGPTRSSR